MSVEDNKEAVRRFTQALDSNNLSILPEICTPACADTWSQGINSDPRSDHHANDFLSRWSARGGGDPHRTARIRAHRDAPKTCSAEAGWPWSRHLPDSPCSIHITRVRLEGA
jgi:hypothetical protein